METDTGLVRLAIAKDSDAFVRAAESVKDKLYHTAYVILGSDADACDAVDETFFYAWRGIHKLREPQFFTTWITRILINQCKKILKRRKKEVAFEESAECSVAYFDTLPIRDAVSRLPDPLRTVISLRYFSDMTVPDIAKLLLLPQGTVKSRLRKALSLLRLEFMVN